MELKGQVAVIAGGGSGLGAATANYLYKQGVKIAILDNNIENANKVAKAVDGIALECDVSDASNGRDAIKLVMEKLHAITICVNCAGIATAGRIVSRKGALPLDEYRQVIDVNLIGTFNIMRLCAEQMMKQDPVNDDGERGVIINTASVAAFEGQVGQAAYSASKGGIVSMLLPAAREFANFGIRVMAIAPGVIATPMMAAMSEEVQEKLAMSMPFPKRLGKANEYAQLVSEIIRNPYLNGSVIRLDAAMRMSSQ